ncbi:MAG: methyltransferase [Geminicoccaceae bacterium]
MQALTKTVYRMLFKLKRGTEPLNYGRETVTAWAADHCRSLERARILDLGLGSGQDLLNIRAALPDNGLELHGVESHPPHVASARESGIQVAQIDLERERLLHGDATIDVVIANQVIEHTKEIFWIFAEVARVLRPGGIAIIGVPNLASLHNRVALLVGQQPPAIETLGPHVRGFTAPAFRRFVTATGHFTLEARAGANFYPLPPSLAKPLARLLPGLAVGSIYRLRRTGAEGSFLDVLDRAFFETNYYRGPAPSD